MATQIKYLKTFLFLPFLVCLYGCPDENDCNDIVTGGIAEVPDLIMIEPLQETYQKGDEIILKCFVASTNNYFGEEIINLFQETNDNSALLIIHIFANTENLFGVNNNISFIKGGGRGLLSTLGKISI